MPERFDPGHAFERPRQPRCAVLILQGSGPHDRDGAMPAFGFRSTLYRRLARELSVRASALCLRYDKRGFDLPADAPRNESVVSRLEDARLALGVLRREAGALPVFLAGHSEGALLAARLACEKHSGAIAGVASLAAPFGNVFEVNRERARRAAAAGSASARRKALRALEFYDRLEDLFREGAGLRPDEFRRFAQPWLGAGFHGWESFEWLAQHWAGILEADPPAAGVPMLVVQGGRDARLPAENPARWQAWCEPRPGADYRFFPEMGHDLNDAGRKAFTPSIPVLESVANWLLQRSPEQSS